MKIAQFSILIFYFLAFCGRKLIFSFEIKTVGQISGSAIRRKWQMALPLTCLLTFSGLSGSGFNGVPA